MQLVTDGKLIPEIFSVDAKVEIVRQIFSSSMIYKNSYDSVTHQRQKLLRSPPTPIPFLKWFTRYCAESEILLNSSLFFLSDLPAQFAKDFEAEELGEVEDDLPEYFPALMGCRNVESYEWLNRIEEGTYGVVHRGKDRRTGGLGVVGASVGLGEAGWVVWCISPRFLEFWQLDCLLYRLASL